MLIKGYGAGPLVAGEDLVDRAGFWANHLLSMCRYTAGGERPIPEWFGDDGADTDALSDVLMDDAAWPVFRVPFQAGHCAVVVYRNLVGDFGVDYLLTHPDWSRAESVYVDEGDGYGPGLSWRDIDRIARTPDLDAPGVHDPAQRLLLLLPLLADDDLPDEAEAAVADALTEIGAPAETVWETADHLLGNRNWADARCRRPSVVRLGEYVFDQ
ncbi:hypothetical protein [Yinghuangia soli]|uniref:Uncharacterized protein n=1 Tax=Yinghuangia soli TaxID=2908204 RepID=A0AA41Q1V0_9ACTN|nr:hypothetical protein [Yinghuangia soli]MCF2529983.1 hypothetical protein [Yinghuangia soli]